MKASEEAFKRQKQSKKGQEMGKEAQIMEVLSGVMTKILNTSACDNNDEGYECTECHKFIRAIVVEVQALKIKRKVFPTCECVVVKEEAKIREAQNFAKKEKLTGYLVLAISEKDSRNPRSRHLEKEKVLSPLVKLRRNM